MNMISVKEVRNTIALEITHLHFSSDFCIFKYKGKVFDFPQEDGLYTYSLIINLTSNSFQLSSKWFKSITLTYNSYLFILNSENNFFSCEGLKTSEFLEIRISKDFLRTTIPNESTIWQLNVHKQINIILNSETVALQCPSEIRTIFNGLLLPVFSETILQNKLIKLKTQEIILRCIEGLQRSEFRNNALPPTIKEYELAHQAQKIMRTYKTHREFNLIQLAKQLNTNDNTLKYAFKRTWGCTLYQFFLKMEMEKAKLLLDKGYSAKKTSEILGYSPNHFSSMYKKITGVLPRSCLKKPCTVPVTERLDADMNKGKD